MNDKSIIKKEEVKQLQAINRKLRKTKIRAGRRPPRRNVRGIRRALRVNKSNGDNPVNYVIPTTPNDFRKLPRENLLSALQTYHKYTKARYLMALVHPDIAVQEQIPVKLFSDVPIPTASIGFHEMYQFTTNALGNFLMTWTPTYLMSQPVLTANASTTYSHLSYNNAVALTGSATTPGNIFVPGSYAPNVDLQRYRMVSALLKVSYNGSVLNQAGTMLSCATFDPFLVATGNTTNPITNYSQTLADRFGNFSLIANGLWNKTINITKDSEGLECLYVPMDPDDLIFERVGAYYGSQAGSSGTLQPGTEGAHIGYILAGRNLPVNSTSILVNIYYNFEVIADPSSAPVLRTSSQSTLSAKENREVGDAMSDMIKSNGLIRPVTKPRWSDLLSELVETGVEYIPKIASTIGTLF